MLKRKQAINISEMFQSMGPLPVVLWVEAATMHVAAESVTHQLQDSHETGVEPIISPTLLPGPTAPTQDVLLSWPGNLELAERTPILDLVPLQPVSARPLVSTASV